MGISEEPLFNTVSSSPSVFMQKIKLSYDHVNANAFSLHINELQIEGSMIHCIYGTNGCGKTSLLKALSGVISINSGSMEWININKPKPGIDFVFVTQAGPLPHWNVWKNIVQPQIEQGIDKGTAEKKAISVINLLGLNGLEQRYAYQLSTGQKQRTVLARALALSPKILLLDEIMSGQSEFWAKRIAVFLRSFSKMGGMIIMVSHDPEWVMVNADRVTHLVSNQDDAVSSTEFFCGFNGSGKEWSAFREQRLLMNAGE